MSMKLRLLTIELKPSYHEQAGKYVADVEYEGEKGKVSMTLEPAISEQLLGFIGPAITKFSHSAALQIEASIAHSIAEVNQPLIEAGTV